MFLVGCFGLWGWVAKSELIRRFSLNSLQRANASIKSLRQFCNQVWRQFFILRCSKFWARVTEYVCRECKYHWFYLCPGFWLLCVHLRGEEARFLTMECLAFFMVTDKVIGTPNLWSHVQQQYVFFIQVNLKLLERRGCYTMELQKLGLMIHVWQTD